CIYQSKLFRAQLFSHPADMIWIRNFPVPVYYKLINRLICPFSRFAQLLQNILSYKLSVKFLNPHNTAAFGAFMSPLQSLDINVSQIVMIHYSLLTIFC